MVEAFEFHVIGEMAGVNPAALKDQEFIQEAVVTSVVRSGLTLFEVLTMKRKEGGVLSIAIIGESHVAVHTWPEDGKVTVTVSSCKDPESTWQVFWELKEIFGAKDYQAMELRSGILLTERAILAVAQ